MLAASGLFFVWGVLGERQGDRGDEVAQQARDADDDHQRDKPLPRCGPRVHLKGRRAQCAGQDHHEDVQDKTRDLLATPAVVGDLGDGVFVDIQHNAQKDLHGNAHQEDANDEAIG